MLDARYYINDVVHMLKPLLDIDIFVFLLLAAAAATCYLLMSIIIYLHKCI